MRELKRANQGTSHFLWADRVLRLRKSMNHPVRFLDLGPSQPRLTHTLRRHEHSPSFQWHLCSLKWAKPSSAALKISSRQIPRERLCPLGLRDKKGQGQSYLAA